VVRFLTITKLINELGKEGVDNVWHESFKRVASYHSQ
jgi:hypothetical protein